MDLRQQVETIHVLNIDDTSSVTPKEMLLKEQFDSKIYIASDVDEELIILIKFKQNIDLHYIKIHAVSQPITDNTNSLSAPKQAHIYKINNLNVDFNDLKSLKPDITVDCSTKKLKKGNRINLKRNAKSTIKFKQTRYLAIYIQSNQ
eukprot:402251_1